MSRYKMITLCCIFVVNLIKNIIRLERFALRAYYYIFLQCTYNPLCSCLQTTKENPSTPTPLTLEPNFGYQPTADFHVHAENSVRTLQANIKASNSVCCCSGNNEIRDLAMQSVVVKTDLHPDQVHTIWSQTKDPQLGGWGFNHVNSASTQHSTNGRAKYNGKKGKKNVELRKTHWTWL